MPFDMQPRPEPPLAPLQQQPIEFPSKLRKVGNSTIGATWKPIATPPPSAPRSPDKREPKTDSRRSSRRQALWHLGFASTGEYHRSALWETVQEKAFAELGSACIRCRQPASALFFSRYTTGNLCGRTTKHVYPVCPSCLARSQQRLDGRTTSLAEATHFLFHCFPEPPAAGEGPIRNQPRVSWPGHDAAPQCADRSPTLPASVPLPEN